MQNTVGMDMFKPVKQRYRKHRKTSKESGEQVWSDDVEKLFIDGLKRYLHAPEVADLPRGRSRGRNQYMVQYLESKGILRTKKQVASHVQVLRNAWKGQPDYYLVTDTPQDGIKEEETLGRLSIPGSPGDYASQPGSPGEVPESPISSDGSTSPFSPLDVKLEPLSGPSRSTRNRSRSLPQPQSFPSLTTPSQVDWVQLHQHAHPDENFQYTQNLGSSISSRPSVSLEEPIFNRICSVTLWADGLSPVSFKINPQETVPPRPSRIVMPLKLRIPAISNAEAPVTLHGFKGCVSIARTCWMSAQCRTCVYAGETITAEETAEMHFHIISRPGEPDRIEANLPDSPLTTCRFYLDSSTKITQHIVVDTHVLGIITYDLEGSSQSIIAGSHSHTPAVWQEAETRFFTMPVVHRPAPFSLPASPHPDADEGEGYETHTDVSLHLPHSSAANRPRALTGISPSVWQSPNEMAYGGSFAV